MRHDVLQLNAREPAIKNDIYVRPKVHEFEPITDRIIAKSLVFARRAVLKSHVASQSER